MNEQGNERTCPLFGMTYVVPEDWCRATQEKYRSGDGDGYLAEMCRLRPHHEQGEAA